MATIVITAVYAARPLRTSVPPRETSLWNNLADWVCVMRPLTSIKEAK
jgi:hypothetical protein